MVKIKEKHEHDSEHAWDVPKTRKCLICRTPFESEWSGERVCKRCKSTAAWKSGSVTGGF